MKIKQNTFISVSMFSPSFQVMKCYCFIYAQTVSSLKTFIKRGNKALLNIEQGKSIVYVLIVFLSIIEDDQQRCLVCYSQTHF